jgi:hypothetical protein
MTMKDSQDPKWIRNVAQRITESVGGVGKALEKLEGDLDLNEMTEGPSKQRIVDELYQLHCVGRLMKFGFGRLEKAILEHYGVAS